MKNLYKKNLRTLNKEIEEDTKWWENLPHSWTVRINIVKRALVPKVIYIFNAVSIIFQWHFHGTKKGSPKIHMDTQKAVNVQSRESIARDIALSDLKLYYTFIATKTAQHGHKSRHVEQSNTTGHPEMNQHSYGHSFYKGYHEPCTGQKTTYSTNGAEKWNIYL